MALFPRLVDASSQLTDLTLDLPNGATSVTKDVDLGALNATLGVQAAEFEIEVQAPILSTAQLPDTDTLTWSLECDSDAAYGSVKIINGNFLQQLGAGAAGAVAKTAKARVQFDCERYLRIKATNTGTGNCSTSSAVVKFNF